MNKNTFIFGLFFLLFFYSSCTINRGIKEFEKKEKYSSNSSVLGLNAINADYNYYTKAVLEYLLVKEIVEGHSKISYGFSKKNPEEEFKFNKLPVSERDNYMLEHSKTQMLLFPSLEEYNDQKATDIMMKLKKEGTTPCFFDLPKTLEDLESGFQFNHYVFESSNRAALQAFGIVDSQINEKSLYIVTDYLQYKDVKCTGIPTIRYAVGMRAQFRISEIDTKSDLSGIGSLAGLAAQVETNQRKVNITIKTIGITGIGSRLSIPSNTAFDVKTYSDYEKIIDFIRNLDDNKFIVDSTGKKQKDIIISPQIIPVMDDYRTTVEHTFYPLYESVELLESKLKSLEKDLDETTIQDTKSKIAEIKLKLLKDEIYQVKRNREVLVLGNGVINDYSKYNNLIKLLVGENLDSVQDPAQKSIKDFEKILKSE